MYKIYNTDGNALCVKTLGEVRELTGATNEQIKNLFVSKVTKINGFEVINYTH